jgi:hypothetical protein
MSDIEITYEKPEYVPVGESTIITLTVKNTSGLLLKSFKLKPNIPDITLSGDIPVLVNNGESFHQKLTITPKTWNPSGLTCNIEIEYIQVSS